MISLKDWTTYVYAGVVVAAGLGWLFYYVNFDIYKTEDAPSAQFNSPELKQGTWRLGHQPNMDAPVRVGMFVVFRVHGCDNQSRVSRVIATEGQRVEVKHDSILVDGAPYQSPVAGQTRALYDVPEVMVPHGCVFVVSDERGKSHSDDYDSRFLGPIPIDAITHCFKPQKGG